MKTEQEQIEEMAQCMCGSKKECIKFYNEEHPCVNNGMCKNIQAAEIFYNAGYRKASDVIDEFVERIKERALHSCCEIINCYEVTRIETVIDDIAAEMR